MFTGRITIHGSMIGIIYDENQFIKLSMKELASQVIDQDIVEFQIINQQGVVMKIIERRNQPFIGIVSKITSKCIYLHLPLLSPCSSISCPLPFEKISVGSKVVGWIYLDRCEIIEIIESNKDLIQRYYLEFSKIDITSLLISSNKNNRLEKVKDLTHLQTFHIDPSGCIDIDDFMSIDIQERKIYIHIIDISKYIEIGSKEDKIGLLYGYTWYLSDLVLHLYPNVSSIYDSDIYCITMEITFQEQISKVELYKSKIRLCHKFIYSEIQEIFDGRHKEHPLKKEFDWSLQMLKDIYLPDESSMRRLKWKHGDKLEIEYENELLSHRYVSGWMIFYNSWIAQTIRVQNQLLPQRHHPETKTNKSIEIDVPKEVQHIMYVKQFRQAEYMNKAGHFGLSRNFYTHATSPLRRYFDRWIQYMYSYDIWEDGEKLMEHLNRMERLAESVADWYHKQLLFEYIEQKKDKLWEGYVVKVHARGIEYYIYDIQEFIYHIGNDKQLGDKVFLKLQVDRSRIPILKIV